MYCPLLRSPWCETIHQGETDKIRIQSTKLVYPDQAKTFFITCSIRCLWRLYNVSWTSLKLSIDSYEIFFSYGALPPTKDMSINSHPIRDQQKKLLHSTTLEARATLLTFWQLCWGNDFPIHILSILPWIIIFLPSSYSNLWKKTWTWQLQELFESTEFLTSQSTHPNSQNSLVDRMISGNYNM